MIAITYFPTLRNAQGTRKATSWPKLCSWLSRPVISPVKDDTAGFSVATYASDRRALANVERVFALGIDLDHLDALSVHTTRGDDIVEAPDWTSLRSAFNNCAAFVYTTWSSTLDLPRLRVLMLLSRPVNAEEYRRVYSAVVGRLERGGYIVDRNASDPSRFWFRPAVRKEGCPFVFWTCNGPAIDVERALAAVPPPPPPPPPAPRPLATGGPSAFDRARRYVEKCDPAVQGSGGRTHTFMLAQRLVRGFDLSVADAFVLMSEWNQRCLPPWSDRDLRAKCEEAAKAGRFQQGDMLARERAR